MVQDLADVLCDAMPRATPAQMIPDRVVAAAGLAPALSELLRLPIPSTPARVPARGSTRKWP